MASQKKFALSDFGASPDQIREAFLSIAGNNPMLEDLGYILEVGISNMPLFPQILLGGNATYSDYLSK